MKKIRILLADDHLLLSEGIASLLQRRNFEIVGIAHDGTAMLAMAHEHKPDLIVADITMPLLNGVDAARMICKELPSTKIVFLTMHNALPLLEDALCAGAAGFITKNSGGEELVRGIRAVWSGEVYITPSLAGKAASVIETFYPNTRRPQTRLSARQQQILQLLAQGKTMKEAGVIMGISKRTAEVHKYEIMRRLGIRTNAELIRFALNCELT